MNLYVWKDYATDYSPGLAVAIASTANEARDLIIKEAGYRASELDRRPTVVKLTKKAAFEVAGGS